ncbi:hypothetical protein BLNAU_2971 [Blattamonas nauphoetae]|uniref:Uncharacterized protein n=1 Tax=Blattamonas nauphoetae TaxID=2049346 RepID=A0ABQ9YDR8_9EUKA|nr:hypothetical protein BLNAU_2971 [Blattamonas nauphoetae]
MLIHLFLCARFVHAFGVHTVDLASFFSEPVHIAQNIEQPNNLIRLPNMSFYTNTIHLSDRNLVTEGTPGLFLNIFEGPKANDSLFISRNTTLTFKYLSFEAQTMQTLCLKENSYFTMQLCQIRVLEAISPFECLNSELLFDEVSFERKSPNAFSPTLVTTTSDTSKVEYRKVCLRDFRTIETEPLLSSRQVSFVSLDQSSFLNISQACSTLMPLNREAISNVSVTNSEFRSCSNDVRGGIVRDMNDGTSILCLNSTFTLSQASYQNNQAMTRITTGTTPHIFTNCTWTGCRASDSGGAIKSIKGDLSITSCNFHNNTCRNDSSAEHNGRGGAVYHLGNDIASCSIIHCNFVWNNASTVGTLDTYNATSLSVTYVNCSYSKNIGFSATALGHVTALHFQNSPDGSIISYIRNQHNYGTSTSGAIDMDAVKGSMTFSNIYVENCTAATGGAIIYSQVVGTPVFKWFSCVFFGNKATTTVGSASSGNDVRFAAVSHWNTTLASNTTFVNCFSTSAHPRIVVYFADGTAKFATHFSSSVMGGQAYDIRLPDPGLFIGFEVGQNAPLCGSTTDAKCKTLGYVGAMDKIPLTGGTVLLDPGVYEETEAFDMTDRSTTFSAYGNEVPILKILVDSSTKAAFVTKGTGSLEVSYMNFWPSTTAAVFLQNGVGKLIIHDCEFSHVSQGDGQTSTVPIVSVALIKATAGSVSLSKVTVEGITFDSGCVVSMSGSTSATLSISDSTFTSLSGLSTSSLLVLPPSTSPILEDLSFEGISSSVSGSLISEEVGVGETLRLEAWKCVECSTSGSEGGVVHASVVGGVVQIVSCSFKTCSATGIAGALFIDLSSQTGSGSLTLTSLTFGRGAEANSASTGSDIFFRIRSEQRDLLRAPQVLQYVRSATTSPRISFIGSELDEVSFEEVDEKKVGGSLLHLVNGYSSGDVFVDWEIGRDHVYCGTLLIPCKTIQNGTDNAKQEGQTELTIDVLSQTKQSSEIAIQKDIALTSYLGSRKTIDMTSDDTLVVAATLVSISELIFTVSAASFSKSVVSHQAGSLSIVGCEFKSIASSGNGAAVHAILSSSTSLKISSTTFTTCTSTGNGGALSISMTAGSFVIGSGTTFSTCSALKGNAMFVTAPDLEAVITPTSMGFLTYPIVSPCVALWTSGVSVLFDWSCAEHACCEWESNGIDVVASFDFDC